MRTLVQKQDRARQGGAFDVSRIRRSTAESSAGAHPLLDLQRTAGNRAVQGVLRAPASAERPYRRNGGAPRSDTENRFKTWGSAGGLSGLTLDVTFSVTKTPASSLQVIQTFMGTRRSDGIQVGTYTWKRKGKRYDAFVDGGKNSPYVTMGGNPPAHPTKPYYLTPTEVASQVSFTKDTGTVRVFDRPGAVALHDEAYFETAIVAVDHKGTGKDKVLKAFRWGWTGKGTKPLVAKGAKIAGTASGLSVRGSVTAGFKNIVKHDYPKYTLS